MTFGAYPFGQQPFAFLSQSNAPVDPPSNAIEDIISLSLDNDESIELTFSYGPLATDDLIYISTPDEWIEIEQTETEFVLANTDDDGSQIDDSIIQLNDDETALFAFSEIDEENINFTFGGVVDDQQAQMWTDDASDTDDDLITGTEFTFTGGIDDDGIFQCSFTDFDLFDEGQDVPLDDFFAGLQDDIVTDGHDPGPLPIDRLYLDWWRKKHEKPKPKIHIEPETTLEAEPEIPFPDVPPLPENDDDDALALLMLME